MARQKKITLSIYQNKQVKPVLDEGEKMYPIYFRLVYDRKSINFSPDWNSFNNYYDNDEEISSYYGYVNENDFSVIKNYYDSRKQNHKTEKYAVMKVDNGKIISVPQDIIKKDKDGTAYFTESNSGDISLWSDLSSYEHMVEEIVKYEVRTQKSSFSLKGFSKRLSKIYLKSILEIFDDSLSQLIKLELENKIEEKILKRINRRSYFLGKYNYLKKHNLLSSISEELKSVVKIYLMWISFSEENNYRVWRFLTDYVKLKKELIKHFSKSNQFEVTNMNSDFSDSISIVNVNKEVDFMMEKTEEFIEDQLG